VTVPAQTQGLGSYGRGGSSLCEMANTIQLAIDSASAGMLK